MSSRLLGPEKGVRDENSLLQVNAGHGLVESRACGQPFDGFVAASLSPRIYPGGSDADAVVLEAEAYALLRIFADAAAERLAVGDVPGLALYQPLLTFPPVPARLPAKANNMAGGGCNVERALSPGTRSEPGGTSWSSVVDAAGDSGFGDSAWTLENWILPLIRTRVGHSFASVQNHVGLVADLGEGW